MFVGWGKRYEDSEGRQVCATLDAVVSEEVERAMTFTSKDTLTRPGGPISMPVGWANMGIRVEPGRSGPAQIAAWKTLVPHLTAMFPEDVQVLGTDDLTEPGVLAVRLFGDGQPTQALEMLSVWQRPAGTVTPLPLDGPLRDAYQEHLRVARREDNLATLAKRAVRQGLKEDLPDNWTEVLADAMTHLPSPSGSPRQVVRADPARPFERWERADMPEEDIKETLGLLGWLAATDGPKPPTGNRLHSTWEHWVTQKTLWDAGRSMHDHLKLRHLQGDGTVDEVKVGTSDAAWAMSRGTATVDVTRVSYDELPVAQRTALIDGGEFAVEVLRDDPLAADDQIARAIADGLAERHGRDRETLGSFWEGQPSDLFFYEQRDAAERERLLTMAAAVRSAWQSAARRVPGDLIAS